MTSVVTIQSIDENVIKADTDGRGEKTFTVTNISGGSLRLGLQCQFDNEEQKDWAKPRGDIERELGDQGSDQVIVDITAPSDAAPGTYDFKLLVYSTINPNLDFTPSDAITIEVSEPEKKPDPKPFPVWIPIVAVVVVLLIGGVVTWLLWPTALTVPESIIGETRANATKMIEDLGLVVKSETAKETEDFPAGTVMKTTPQPGEELEKGGTVLLTVAKKASKRPKPVITVPILIDPIRVITAFVHGTDDIIWQHKNGQVHFWSMNKGKRTGGTNIHTKVGGDWRLRAAGDVNGDGTDDIVWQHNNGQVLYWPIKKGKRTGSINIHTKVGGDWRLRAVGNVQ